MILESDVRWIWGSNLPEKDVYCAFRKEFFYEASMGRVFVELAADSTFALFVNGVRIPGSQFSDYPMQRTYSTLEITHAVRHGNNAIGIEVHYLGEKFHVYLPGTASLKAAVFSDKGKICVTDESWKCALAPGYRSGSGRVFTFQAGYIFDYDMSKAENWTDVGYDDSGWGNARVYSKEEYDPELSIRPVPQLLEFPEPDEKLCTCGTLLRFENESHTPAQASQADYLKAEEPWDCFNFGEPWEVNPWLLNISAGKSQWEYWSLKEVPANANGRYAIYDLGKEYCGYLKLKLKGSAGTIIDITNGEHLTRGRLLADRGRYNFTDRYVCADGEQEFIFPHRRYGCRYIELHITNITGPLEIGYAGIRPVQLPLPQESGFSSEDGELRRIDEISKRTMMLCMHEHYEDCPWREQALWNFDARIQMFVGYYLWGNYDFAATSLELMRRSYSNGFLSLTEPGISTRTIPMFSLAYIVALYERLLFGGAWNGMEKHLETVDKILDYAMSRKDGDFYYLEKDPKRLWHFYEWQGDLSHVETFPQSTWNIYLCEAMKAAAELHRFAGDAKRASELSEAAANLGGAVEGYFRDEQNYTLYKPGENEKHYELIQLLMLANKLVPEERKAVLWKALNAGYLMPVTSANLIFMLNGLMDCTPEARQFCDRRLMDMYRTMLNAGASTVWETEKGFRDMGGCGSLCHAWSAIAVAYERRYLLGVRPLDVAFGKYEVKIFPGHLTHAEGSVPTPRGMIYVKWSQRTDGLEIQVKSPEGCEIVKNEYPEYPVHSWHIEN